MRGSKVYSRTQLPGMRYLRMWLISHKRTYVVYLELPPPGLGVRGGGGWLGRSFGSIDMGLGRSKVLN